MKIAVHVTSEKERQVVIDYLNKYGRYNGYLDRDYICLYKSQTTGNYGSATLKWLTETKHWIFSFQIFCQLTSSTIPKSTLKGITTETGARYAISEDGLVLNDADFSDGIALTNSDLDQIILAYQSFK